LTIRPNTRSRMKETREGVQTMLGWAIFASAPPISFFFVLFFLFFENHSSNSTLQI
jgi:hypothetical protein